jgi:hypothetical protein
MSALETLAKLPPEKQKDALASVTKSLLPHPGTPQEEPLLVPAELQQKVIGEIKRRLKIQPDDWSSAALTKLLNYISAALSSLILQETDLSEVKERLGQRGDLSPRDYKIVYPADFFNFQKGLAIRPSHVSEALTNPTNVQHLSSGDPGISTDTFPNVSFYSRVQLDHYGEPFSLIVQSIRRKDVQHVYSAWRIYHDNIKMPEVYSPLGVFEAFVSKYGKEFMVADNPVGKFLLYKRLPGVSAEQMIDATKGPKDEEEELMTIQAKWQFSEPENAVYVTFAYALDLQQYCHDLEAHSVPIHPEQIRFGTFGKFLKAKSGK